MNSTMRVLFWLVVAASLIGGLILLAMDYRVPGAAVLITGGPLALFLGVLAYSRVALGLVTREQARRNGIAFIVTGVAISVLSIVLKLVAPGAVADALLVPGIGLALAGLVVRLVGRRATSRT